MSRVAGRETNYWDISSSSVFQFCKTLIENIPDLIGIIYLIGVGCAWITGIYALISELVKYVGSLLIQYPGISGIAIIAIIALVVRVQSRMNSKSTPSAVLGRSNEPRIVAAPASSSAGAPLAIYSPETYQKCREQIQQAAKLVNELPENIRAPVRTIAQMAVRGAVLTARAVYDPSHTSLPKSTRRGSESDHRTVVRDLDKIGGCFV